MLYIKQKNTIKKIVFRGLPLFILVGVFVFSQNIQAADITPGALMRLTNQARKEAGLAALKQNDLLNQAAEAKAKDMFKNDYFAHTSPKGVSPWHWIKQSGYAYGYAGENLAINYDTAESEQKAWMKSPTHRANILNKNYQEIGIAVVEGKIDGKNALVTVALFASPKVVVIKKENGIPTLEKLASDVEGVQTEMTQELVTPLERVAESLTDEKTVIPTTGGPTPRLDRAIWLTLLFLQFTMVLAASPFLYRAWRHMYSPVIWKEKKEGKKDVQVIMPSHFLGVHAFDIHRSKAF